MRSVYHPRKKSKRLERVERMSREEYEATNLDSRVEMIRNLIPLGLIQIFEELDKEVTALCGERYERKNEEVVGSRHGSNPGSVRLGGQKIGIMVPRVRRERSDQKHRWLAVALLDVEDRLRRVRGYRHLSKLREALQRELRIESRSSQSKKVA